MDGNTTGLMMTCFYRYIFDDPMPGQHNDPPDPIQVDGETEWEVNNRLVVRKHQGELQYRVKWLGYDDDPDWYPASYVRYAPRKVRVLNSLNTHQTSILLNIYGPR